METIIQTTDLTKKYKDFFALSQVNLNVEPGDIYGLIGRNGAGKTTLLKVLSRQIQPTQGSFTIQGHAVNAQDHTDLRMGTLIEAPGFYGDLSAEQNMQLKCTLMGIQRTGYIEELLDLVNLAQVPAKKKVRTFSLGMKQKLGLALALVGDPDILLLDEPTNGMDPQGIAEFRQTVLQLNRERHITIIISSHILDELAKFINKVGIIHEGELLVEMSKEELERRNRDHLVLTSSEMPSVTTLLETELNITDYRVIHSTEVYIYESVNQPEKISHALIKAGILFDTFQLKRHSLEEYFIDLTGGVRHA